jgi:hypothetical protein
MRPLRRIQGDPPQLFFETEAKEENEQRIFQKKPIRYATRPG